MHLRHLTDAKGQQEEEGVKAGTGLSDHRYDHYKNRLSPSLTHSLTHTHSMELIGFAVYRVDDPSSTKFPLDTDFFRYHLSTAKPKSFINLREVTAR